MKKLTVVSMLDDSVQMNEVLCAVSDVTKGVVQPNVKQAVKFLDEKFIVRATKRLYKKEAAA